MSDGITRLVDEDGKTIAVVANKGSISATLRPGESLIEVGEPETIRDKDSIRVSIPYHVRTGSLRFGRK